MLLSSTVLFITDSGILKCICLAEWLSQQVWTLCSVIVFVMLNRVLFTTDLRHFAALIFARCFHEYCESKILSGSKVGIFSPLVPLSDIEHSLNANKNIEIFDFVSPA